LARTLINSSPELIYLFFGRGIFLRWVHFWLNILSRSFFALCIDSSMNYLFDWKAMNISGRQKLTMYQHLYSFTSVKQIVHWFQIIRAQRFQMYDDGITMVGQGHIPPRYRLSRITCPMMLFHGDKDTLVNIDSTLRDCYAEKIAFDVPRRSSFSIQSSKSTTNSTENFLFKDSDSRIIFHRIRHYEHLDFLWAEDIDTTVLPCLLPILKSKLAQ
jgi:lysosomal acid lipase/cholesteryl ester hydrolase